jgi:hypothetical protein
MTAPLPPVSLYEQFYVVGLLVLVLALLAAGVWAVVNSVRKWMKEDRAERQAYEAEREEGWQKFIKGLSDQQSKNCQGTNDALVAINNNLVQIHGKLDRHDDWARGAVSNVHELVRIKTQE